MEFGIFDHLDRNDLPLARLLRGAACDRRGLRSRRLLRLSSRRASLRRRSAWRRRPSVFLAAVAQRTKRLRFGPLVYALPLYHPLRMIEEICMLDQMSGGRLEIGFGRGSSPIELDLLRQRSGGSPARSTTRRWRSSCKALTRAHGDLPRQASSTSTTCRWSSTPLQKPHPPLWYGVHAPDSAARGAAQATATSISLDACRRRAPSSTPTARPGRRPAGRRPTAEDRARPLSSSLPTPTPRRLRIARRAYPMWHGKLHPPVQGL